MPTHRARGAHPRSRGAHRDLPPAPAPLYAPGPCGGAGVHELVQPRRPWPYNLPLPATSTGMPTHFARGALIPHSPTEHVPNPLSPTALSAPCTASTQTPPVRDPSLSRPSLIRADASPAHQPRKPSIPICVKSPRLFTQPPANSPTLPRPPPPPPPPATAPPAEEETQTQHTTTPAPRHTRTYWPYYVIL